MIRQLSGCTDRGLGRLGLFRWAWTHQQQSAHKSPDFSSVDEFPVEAEFCSLPARQVAGCIGDKLQAWPESSQQIPILATRLTETGYSISGSATLPGLWGAGGTDTVVLVDIDDLKTKTRVRLYTHFVMGGGVIVKMVRSCL